MTKPLAEDAAPPPGKEPNLRWALRQIEEDLRTLRFGSLTLHVQDGVVVQVERLVKTRYQRGEEAAPAS